MFPVVSQAEDMVKKQYFADATSAKPSLLAKWLPSENASKKETINLAKKMHKILGVSPRIYRRTLSKLRAKLMVHGSVKPLRGEHRPGRVMFE